MHAFTAKGGAASGRNGVACDDGMNILELQTLRAHAVVDSGRHRFAIPDRKAVLDPRDSLLLYCNLDVAVMGEGG